MLSITLMHLIERTVILQDSDYDVVVLQELWMLDDHEIIINATAETYFSTGFYELR